MTEQAVCNCLGCQAHQSIMEWQRLADDRLAIVRKLRETNDELRMQNPNMRGSLEDRDRLIADVNRLSDRLATEREMHARTMQELRETESALHDALAARDELRRQYMALDEELDRIRPMAREAAKAERQFPNHQYLGASYPGRMDRCHATFRGVKCLASYYDPIHGFGGKKSSS